MEAKINAIIAASIAYLAFMALSYIGVSSDLYFNPWIRGLQLQWWNFFTTHHYVTWLFAIGQWSCWLIIASILSLIAAFCIGIWIYVES
jgi:hypothetical protein